MSTRPITTREIQLVAYPDGLPAESDFAVVERDLPALRDGQLLVGNRWVSIDPAQRVRMNPAAAGYLPAFALGAVPASWAVGMVLESRLAGFEVGDLVLHNAGWQEHSIVSLAGGRKPRVVVPSGRIREVDFLGPMGWPGLTAYAGLFDVGELRPGETVFVSGAVGGVGSLVVQLARRAGARVIASVGSREKARFAVEDLGAHEAICYRDGDIRDLLPAVATKGVDVYFDNVGGDHLEAAISVMRPGGRVALCGAVSSYNSAGTPGPSNLFLATAKGLTLRGFLAWMYEHRFERSNAYFGGLIDEGGLVSPHTIIEGLDDLAGGFIGMLKGSNVGKAVVRVG
ncbi:NADP-dependent oxidoreductase [Acrocarpospora macrocephala]|uniref:NADP-dependent oxidoreductase n=1 Tax=Acrocarpospora macrocephala TaxID=150177 RepID=A0A5M3X3R4_9ACTN|nr:NADP-dependent oxidoreductase [Acrocarpospora macrocephala]GES14749.1 NADP-dependent oxidoreductase [Acrocarpospora macrocephala]